jgi:hypothetical protein
MILIRYWFIVYTEAPFGPRNIGATAYSKEEAVSLINESLKKITPPELMTNVTMQTESIENIDIRLLDQNHVIPNMGVVVRKGVWFPNLNY